MREDLIDIHPGRQRAALAAAATVAVPAFALRFAGIDTPNAVLAIVFGLAIVGAAFVLSWAAEVAQLDMSAGLAIAILALIAVLPEYAVSFVFAWEGGNAVERFGASCPPLDQSPCSLVLANMTGANRLLIGIGWSLVVFVAWYRIRKTRSEERRGPIEVRLGREHSIELGYLAVATAYSLLLPLRRSISLFDAVVLVGLFVAYSVRISRAPTEEPHLVGPARYIGSFRTAPRRWTVAAMFLASAAVIVLFAEPFAHALVETGKDLRVSQFLLVQWLAPLASEAPELLVAGLYAWRLNTDAGLGTLVSSKVNQWTLLVGTLPLVFAIASSSGGGLPIDPVQRQELFLTAAQSVFAVAVLANLRLGLREAAALFGLFWAQFVIGAVVPESLHGAERIVVSILYLVLGASILLRDRRRLPVLVRDAFRTSYAELEVERAQDELRRAEEEHPSPPRER